MSATVNPNGNTLKLAFTKEMIDANPEEFQAMMPEFVIGALKNIYLPFRPEVDRLRNRETGVTVCRDENWHSGMVNRANTKMKEIFPAIAKAKKLPENERLALAIKMKALRERIEIEEPLLMEVVLNQKITNELAIKDVNHVILGYLVRYTPPAGNQVK